MLGDSWFPLLEEEINKPYFKQLKETLREEYQNYRVCPAPQDICKAFKLTPLDKVKCVALSQDPYPFGQADGLAFSASNTTLTPYSLRMIFREVDRDVVRTKDLNGFREAFPDNNLAPWALQGVFLINTVLTVRAEQTNSHLELGWQTFTSKVLDLLYEDNTPKVFLGFGAEAQKSLRKYDWSKHKLIEAGHPASGAHGKDKFSGCNFASKTNHWLTKQGVEPINWRLK